MTALFRAQVLQAQQQHWLGPVSVVQPPSLRWGVALAVASLLALVALLSLGSYTRKLALPGVLVPATGIVRLLPEGAGIVLERHVEEGQAVRAGELLFVLGAGRAGRDDATQSDLDAALRAQRQNLENLARQRVALARTRDRDLARRLTAIAAERADLMAELALQQRREILARQTLERLRALQVQGFAHESQVQVRQEELLALEAQGRTLVRAGAALDRERLRLEGERAALPAERDGGVAQVSSDLAELSRDGAGLRGLRRIEVRAPHDGTVHGVLGMPGQTAAPPMALASLLPDRAPLRVELMAAGNTMGAAQVGQTVRLRLEAYPYARFGVLTGRLAQVGRVPLMPADLPPWASGDREPRYRLVVELDPLPPAWSGRPLTAGLRLQADLLLERRRLWEWVLEPLLGLQHRL